MYTKELEDEQKTQAVLIHELAELTSVLKEATMDMNSAVRLQNVVRQLGVNLVEKHNDVNLSMDSNWMICKSLQWRTNWNWNIKRTR